MKVYQVNSMGFLVGETVADESPLEPGVMLMPAGCVELAPPQEVPEGLWPRWNGSSWILATKPAAVTPVDPAAKLKAFFDNNPDVAAYVLSSTDGGADV